MLGILDEENDVFTNHLPEKGKGWGTSAKAMQKKLLRKEAAAELLDSFGGIPKPGEFYDVLTNGQSNAGGFYEVIREKWGKVEEACIATWIINRDYIDMLFSDLDSGRLGNLIFLISNRMSQLGKGHGPNFNVLKSKGMAHPRCEFRIANSHAKVYGMHNGKDYITISGSGNWSENPRLENYCISNDRSRYEFHRTWMLEIAKAK